MTTDQDADIRRTLAQLGIVDMDADTGTKRLPAQALPPEPSAMRQVCGHFTTGVTVVTSLLDGQWVGATVNSFTSVSLDPPWVLFCLRHDSRLLAAVRASGTFAVSILRAHQGPLAMGFAAPGPTDFGGVDCLHGAGGAPILRGAIGYLECEVAEEYHGGDHRIVIGAVTSLGFLDEDGDGSGGSGGGAGAGNGAGSGGDRETPLHNGTAAHNGSSTHDSTSRHDGGPLHEDGPLTFYRGRLARLDKEC